MSLAAGRVVACRLPDLADVLAFFVAFRLPDLADVPAFFVAVVLAIDCPFRSRLSRGDSKLLTRPPVHPGFLLWKPVR
jgi:hypothetical protein